MLEELIFFVRHILAMNLKTANCAWFFMTMLPMFREWSKSSYTWISALNIFPFGLFSTTIALAHFEIGNQLAEPLRSPGRNEYRGSQASPRPISDGEIDPRAIQKLQKWTLGIYTFLGVYLFFRRAYEVEFIFSFTAVLFLNWLYNKRMHRVFGSLVLKDLFMVVITWLHVW